jgi:hypothetical protein
MTGISRLARDKGEVPPAYSSYSSGRSKILFVPFNPGSLRTHLWIAEHIRQRCHSMSFYDAYRRQEHSRSSILQESKQFLCNFDSYETKWYRKDDD